MGILDKKPRLKLPPRGKPYWQEITEGLSLGYRRPATGAGTWSFRLADGKGGNRITKFASTDDIAASNGTTVLAFKEAWDEARKLAGAGAASVADGHPVTVFEALDLYEADLIRRKANKANATHVRYNMTDKLGRKAVALCVENDFTVWRNGLITDSKLSIGSADRLGRILKAVLNLAAKADKRIINGAEWRNALVKLNDSESVRNVILTNDIERAIIDTAYEIDHRLGLWCHLLSDTGNRESQCQKLEVIDLQGDRLMMPSSQKGKGRKRSRKPLPISPELAANLKQHVAGKPRNAPLLLPFRKLAEEFRKVTKRLGLDTESAREKVGLIDEATPYALRHSSIVRHLMRGTPTRLVASAHDTSVAEIERTYSRYIVSDQTEAMLRAALLPVAVPAANVLRFGVNHR
ncbi:site-specific integrase [Bradyrhizobium sp.]|uniref:site-specific integrase n=1 Tax=Bradyrhizobium sp. TaxID=376 RepID=UPI003C71A145